MKHLPISETPKNVCKANEERLGKRKKIKSGIKGTEEKIGKAQAPTTTATI